MEKKNKVFWIITFVLIGIFLMFTFWKTIPIPAENIEGINNPNKYIFGGFYFTSILYQLNVGNYFGVGMFGALFFICISLNYLLILKN